MNSLFRCCSCDQATSEGVMHRDHREDQLFVKSPVAHVPALECGVMLEYLKSHQHSLKTGITFIGLRFNGSVKKEKQEHLLDIPFLY